MEKLYNDRDIFPDDTAPAPLETLHRNRKRTIHTLFGPVELRRNYLHHAKSRTGRFPLDELLALEGACTSAVARLMCLASSCAASYREAADQLRELAALDFDPRDLGRLVTLLAPKLREILRNLPEPPQPRPAPDVLYVSCDGTGTPMRKAELLDCKAKPPDAIPKTREAKLGCVFTQTDLDAQGAPLRDPDSTSYVGTLEGCRDLAVLLHQEALRRNLPHAKRVVFLGDGAAWIWENARQTFPDAIEILDFYHASEHVGELAKAIHEHDPPAAAALRERWCHEMKESSPTPLLAETLKLLETHTEWSEDKRAAIQAQIHYLQSHATRTHYGRYRREGLFIGSGIIEAGCKTVIGRRLKQSGMFWSKPGAENILSLRCLVLGPHFETAWEQLKAHNARERLKARRWSPQQNQLAA